MNYIIKSVVYGAILGDSVGLPYEFKSRPDLDAKPAADLTGWGTFNLPPGSWTDDTSLSLAAMDSLSRGLDLKSIAENFTKWLFDAKFTPFGETFDVGRTTADALTNYKKNGDPTSCGLSDEYSNGNGSLMRMYPLSLYILDIEDIEERHEIIKNYSAITHAHPRTIAACMIFDQALGNVIKYDKLNSNMMTHSIQNIEDFILVKYPDEHRHFERIFNGEIFNLPREEVQSSGYVVHTLEASMWCLANTSSYAESVLAAVNLGEDTDTTATVTGALTGGYYGYDHLPEPWLAKLQNKSFISKIIENYSEALIAKYNA